MLCVCYQKAKAVYIRLYRLLDASVEVATFGKIMNIAQQKAIAAQFDQHFQPIAQQLETVLSATLRILFKPLSQCWAELRVHKDRVRKRRIRGRKVVSKHTDTLP